MSVYHKELILYHLFFPISTFEELKKRKDKRTFIVKTLVECIYIYIQLSRLRLCIDQASTWPFVMESRLPMNSECACNYATETLYSSSTLCIHIYFTKQVKVSGVCIYIYIYMVQNWESKVNCRSKIQGSILTWCCCCWGCRFWV